MEGSISRLSVLDEVNIRYLFVQPKQSGLLLMW